MFVPVFGSSGCAPILPPVCSTGNNNNAVVTASYAVFTENNKSIPLAVVGHQFQHLKLLSEFNSITAQVKVETFMNNINMTF